MGNYRELAPRLVALLEQHYGSRAEASRALGVHQSLLTRWGDGSNSPSFKHLLSIYEACPASHDLIRSALDANDV